MVTLTVEIDLDELTKDRPLDGNLASLLAHIGYKVERGGEPKAGDAGVGYVWRDGSWSPAGEWRVS